MQPYVLAKCLTDQTKTRRKQLESLLRCEGGPTPGSACGLSSQNAIKVSPTTIKPQPAESKAPVTTKIGQLSVCKATIAALMGQDPRSITQTKESDGVTFLAYTRVSDGTRWQNKCRVSGDTVEWGSSDGRWRNHPLDEKITYRLDQGAIIIRQKFDDGSVLDKTFQAGAF